MTEQFRNILRETGIEFSAEWSSRLASAVDEVGNDRPDLELLLDLVRLCFSVGQVDDESFRERLNATGEEGATPIVTSPSQPHLVAVLASAVLVARFISAKGLRAKAASPSVTCAALAIRMLSRTDWQPVHPDVRGAAEVWLASASLRDRRGPLSGLPSARRRTSEADAAGQPPADPQAELRTRLEAVEQGFDPSIVRALAEQNAVVWWLVSTPDRSSPSESAIQAAEHLAAMTRFPSPIPSAPELLRRRLDSAGKRATVKSLRLLKGHVPDDVPSDFVPLSAGIALPQRPSVLDLAVSLYDELSFADAYEEASRS